MTHHYCYKSWHLPRTWLIHGPLVHDSPGTGKASVGRKTVLGWGGNLIGWPVPMSDPAVEGLTSSMPQNQRFLFFLVLHGSKLAFSENEKNSRAWNSATHTHNFRGASRQEVNFQSSKKQFNAAILRAQRTSKYYVSTTVGHLLRCTCTIYNILTDSAGGSRKGLAWSSCVGNSCSSWRHVRLKWMLSDCSNKEWNCHCHCHGAG